MNVTYVTTYDSNDVHQWSGLGYYIGHALEQNNICLERLGNLEIREFYYRKLKSLLYSKLFGKTYSYNRDTKVVKCFGDQILRRCGSGTDIFFSPGSVPLTFLETAKPKVFYTDATFAALVSTYPHFANLSADDKAQGNFLERKAIQSATLAIYSSQWAAESAIQDYDADPSKVHVVPFGANLETTLSASDIRTFIRGRSSSVCRLLFIGVDWIRKGGPLALAVANRLNDLGLRTELHVVGVNKISENLPSFVINHGYITKRTAEGRKKIEELFKSSHFLIVPSEAEAYGLVFCEANSFGVPAISRKVGGIPSVITDYENGVTFSKETELDNYVDFILQYYGMPMYEDLAMSSFNAFTARLNWRVSGKTIANLLRQI